MSRLRAEGVLTGAAVACVLSQAYGGQTVGSIAAALGFVLATVATYRADPKHLSAILVLCFPALGLGVLGTEAAILPIESLWAPVPVAGFAIAGGQLDAPVGVMLGALGRLSIDLLVRPSAGTAFPWWARPLFFVALIPVSLAAVQAQAAGLNQWSQGVRGVLALGGLFWGARLARHPGTDIGHLAGRIVGLAIVGSLLVLLGLLRGHLLFLVTGIAAAAIPHLFRPFKPLALLLAGLATFVALAASTLTTAAMVVIAFCVSLLARLSPSGLRRLGVGATITLAVTVGIGTMYSVYAARATTDVGGSATNDGLPDYVAFKVFSDRGPLWLGAIDQISSPPWIVVPPGRSLYPDGAVFASRPNGWEFGAHNAFLELIRNVGLLSGSIGVLLMLYSVFSVTKLLSSSTRPRVQAVAGGFIGIVVVGAMTGNFLVQDVGFFAWALGGVAVASRHAWKTPPIRMHVPPIKRAQLREVRSA